MRAREISLCLPSVQDARAHTHSLTHTRTHAHAGYRHTYDNIGELGNGGMSQHHVPVFIHTLIPLVLPKLGESGAVVDALKRGCRVADVGCGAAGPTMVLAGAFPSSSFDGFELSEVRFCVVSGHACNR